MIYRHLDWVGSLIIRVFPHHYHSTAHLGSSHLIIIILPPILGLVTFHHLDLPPPCLGGVTDRTRGPPHHYHSTAHLGSSHLITSDVWFVD